MTQIRGIHVACIVSGAFACSGEDRTQVDRPVLAASGAALRDPTAAEASEDLEQVFTLVDSLYGPYAYKEARFGYSIAELQDEAREKLASTPGDDGFYAAASGLLSQFDDGHVALVPAPGANPISAHFIGILLQPVEGKALVAELFDPSLTQFGVSYGDEVLAVDGVSPFELLEEFLELQAFGNPLSNQHLIYRTFIRQGFAESIRPTSPTARVDFRRADGSEYARDFIWRESREQGVGFAGDEGTLPALSNSGFLARGALDINAFARGSLARWGATQPFFLTAATAATFDITAVTPNLQTLAKYGLDPAALPDIYSAIYSHAGKNILLIRQSGYGVAAPADLFTRLQYYRAVMDQFDNFVDGLVIDQTHNPGGNLFYCIDFARLFASAPGKNFVQAYNADRRWVHGFRGFARLLDPALSSEESLRYEFLGSRVEAAYDAGRRVTEPLPLYLTEELPPDDIYVWTKPRLVLIDELAGSCGDVFPMLIQRNGYAPLFGRRTMGLGGNVEAFGPLAHSQATLYLTRGTFTTHQNDGAYAPGDFIENNGVVPDTEHAITAADFRSGFVDYMTHFSDVLLSQINAPDSQ